jgi:hypothetical protein
MERGEQCHSYGTIPARKNIKKGDAKWFRPDPGTGRILSGPTNKASRVCFSALAMVQILLALVTTL